MESSLWNYVTQVTWGCVVGSIPSLEWRIGRGGRGGDTFHVRVGPVLTQHMRGWEGTFHRLCWGRVNTSNRWCVVLCVVGLCCVVLCCVWDAAF